VPNSGGRPIKPVIKRKAKNLTGGIVRKHHNPKRRNATIGSQVLENNLSRKSVNPNTIKFSFLRQL
jgi:hypothetical protein